MIDKIIEALGRLSIADYRINEDVTESLELFFVKKQLDMRRLKEAHEYNVTVFRDFVKENENKRGFSSVLIHPGMEDSEIEAAIKSTYYAASFVANDYFELPDKEQGDTVMPESILAELPLQESAVKMAEALFKEDKDPEAFLNSAELFVTKLTSRIIGSQGTQVSYVKYGVKGEFVVQCLEPQDVELYESFSYNDLKEEALSLTVKEALRKVKDRARAKEGAPAGQYTVLLSHKHVAELLSYYVERSEASMIYPKYSSYSLGTRVQGEELQGEALNITLKAVVPYSDEGIKMVDRPLIKEGELKLIHGSNRFCRYLGIEPTGSYSSFRVDNGSLSFAEMKKEKHLYVVSFSDFQMDSFSGYFAGEIRLGYLFDGENTTLITGGSINGSLLEAHKNLVFSKERYEDSSYEGPLAIRLEGVKVAGI